MEELLGLESIICDVIEEDVPEYNQVKDDDSIAVKNAKLAAQAKQRAAGSQNSSTANNNPPPQPSGNVQHSSGQNGGSLLWKNTQKKY